MLPGKNNIQTFTDLVSVLSKRKDAVYRKQYFGHYFLRNHHRLFEYPNGNIYVLKGAVYSDTEFHVAEKLTKAGYHVVFPGQGDLGKGRKHDVFLYDSKTFIQQKAELKSLFGNTARRVKEQLIYGSGQASIVVYDVQSNISPLWLKEGLKQGWSKNLYKILINWKGQWYEVNKDKLYNGWIERQIK